MAGGRRPARLEHRTDAHHRPRHHQRDRLPARRPRLVPARLHPAARPVRQADLGRVRRRLHGRPRPLQRPRGRPPPLRLHRIRPRPDRPGAHRRPHRERPRGAGAQPAAEQSLVLRQRHLPRGPPRGHRARARTALGHVRHHAPGERGTRRRPGGDGRRQHLGPRARGRGQVVRRGRRRTHGGPGRLHGPGDRRGERDPRTHRRPPPDLGLRGPAPVHPAHRTARRRPDGRHLPHPLRHPHLPRRPRGGIPPQREVRQDQGRRPPPRPRRTRRRRQRRRDPPSDDDHEVDGRQRLPHLPQPALARDDRGLRGTGHRDAGGGLRLLAHRQEPL